MDFGKDVPKLWANPACIMKDRLFSFFISFILSKMLLVKSLTDGNHRMCPKPFSSACDVRYKGNV